MPPPHAVLDTLFSIMSVKYIVTFYRFETHILVEINKDKTHLKIGLIDNSRQTY